MPINNSTFVKITNQDIYNGLQELRRDFAKYHSSNETSHKKIDSKSSKALIVSTLCLALITIVLSVMIVT